MLPCEDLGLGPLVALAEELDFGHGPLDLLAVDASGRLVIIEFKRGTENPDVRKVIAQLLDYGSALWRQSVESLTDRINAGHAPLDQSLLAHVTVRLEALGVEFDPDLFLEGLAACLDQGDFVFLYVARDLDDRTKKVMTFLAEGPRLTFFAVEVDHFVGQDAAAARSWCLVQRLSRRGWPCRRPPRRPPRRPRRRRSPTRCRRTKRPCERSCAAWNYSPPELGS